MSEQMEREGREPESARKSPRRRRTVVFWLVAVLAVCAASGGLVVGRTQRLEKERSEREKSLARGPRVLVMPVEHGQAQRHIELPASLHGYIETRIYAKTAGYLNTIRVDKGDRVKKGEVLAELEAPELDKQVANMKADYDIKALTDRRDRIVAEAGGLSRQEADVAHADAVQALAMLEQYKALQAYKIIVAPADGVITARYADPGALIPQSTSSTGGTPIVSLATLQPIRVYAEVPQPLTPYVKDGDPAVLTVQQYPRRKFEGTITRHPEALAADTRTMQIEVDLPNADSALLPGMYGTLRITVSQPDVPRVLDDSLVFRDNKVYVPTVRDDRLHLAEVTLGFDDGRHVEITQGISNDDVVAVNLGQGVRDGEAVQPIEVKPTPGSSAARTGGPR
jgi:membrane fusion protein, multidrug efflux system